MTSNASHGTRSVTTAAERVEAFCDSHDGWNGVAADYVTQTGEYGADDRVTLSKADLRELLADNERLRRAFGNTLSALLETI